MKRPLASSALPSIKLTLDEKLAVVSHVSTVLDRNLALEADFRHHGSVVDKNEWKEVKTTPNVRVLHAGSAVETTEFVDGSPCDVVWRREALGLNSAETEPSSTESSTSSASIDESFINQFLCTGQVDGQIEDVLLGAFGGSDTACKERSAYIKDRFEESRILATIDAPSAFEPFRFLGIKWYTTGYPRALGRFMTKRDALVIEATGISVDTNGEKYGYYLLHDYYHPSLPELTDHSNIRQKLSLCLLSRQVTPDHVALYVRGHCDVDGDLLKSVGLAIASIADTAETSNSRKLVRLMHQEQLQRLHVREKRNHTRAIGCHSCQRTPRFHSLVECRVCAHTFCSKCLEDRKVVVDTARSKFKLDTLSFCSGCVSAAKYLSSVDVARAAFVLPLS